MSWFMTGEEGYAALEHDEARREENRKERVHRHWMPVGSEMKFSFLDAEVHPAGYPSPFVFKEHNLKLNGHWRNWYTCIEGVPHPETGKPQQCPLCGSGDRPYLASAFTIVDHSKWQSKKNPGAWHEHEIKLFVCKAAVQKTLRKAAKKRGGLRGWLVDVSRNDDKSPATGDQFDFEQKFNDSQFEEFTGGKFKAIPEPLNYHEIFKPRSAEELQRLVAPSTPGAYDDSYYGGEETSFVIDDDVVQY